MTSSSFRFYGVGVLRFLLHVPPSWELKMSLAYFWLVLPLFAWRNSDEIRSCIWAVLVAHLPHSTERLGGSCEAAQQSGKNWRQECTVKRAASCALRSHASMSMTCTALFKFTPMSGLSMALVARHGSWLLKAAKSQYALEFCYTWSPPKIDT